MFDRTLRLAVAAALGLTGCSWLVASQLECRSSADCTENAACVDGVCVAPPDAGVADAGVDAGSADAGSGADAGASVVGFSVTGRATPIAGQATSVTVTARTANQQTATGYRGTVHFSSTGATRAPPALPADYTFVEADHGQHSFDVTFREATTQALTASDAADSRINGSMNFTVQAGEPAKVVLTGVPEAVAAGTASTLTVSVLDADDNPVPGFTGSVAFSSSDAKAQLPPSTTFLPSENGSHTFPAGVVLKTAGPQTLTAHVTGTNVDRSSELQVEVSAGALDSLSVSGIGTAIPTNFDQTVTVAAQDACGNTVPGYRGTVHFTSEDPSTTLPGDYTFVEADKGSHTFQNQVRFAKSGTFSVTAADTAQSSIRGVQSNIVVQAGAATRLTVTGIPGAATAGVTYSVRVTAVDGNGNISTSYLDTVTLTSSDGRATFSPASHTFAAADAGVFEFSVVLRTAGSQRVTATDVAHRTGAQTGIGVVAAAASALAVSGVQSPIVARAAANLSVAAVDAFGNTDRGYRGTVRLTSSDPSAALPGNHTFSSTDSGAYTFTGVSFRTPGAQSVTATDVAHANINGKQDSISVVPGPVASLAFLQQPANTTVGAAISTVQVRLADQDSNLATNATAQVTLSLQTSPSGATLSGTRTLSPSEGLATFTGLTVDRAGTYSLRATVAGSSAAGTSNSFSATCATGYAGSDCKDCANGYKASGVTPGTCVAVCSEANPCTSPPADSCSGNNLVQHSAPGTCSPSAAAPYYSCAYASTEVSCADAMANGICFTDSVAHCIADPCVGVTCANQAPDCEADGVTRNTYLGSCAPTGAGAHVCNQAKTPALCAGQVCYQGACAAAAAPAAGELAISEVMHTPAADSVAQRWFEVTNLSSSLRNLAGLTVEDGAGHSFSVPASPPSLIASGGRYVFGEAAASGVNAALLPSSFALSAAGGTLQLKAGSTPLIALTWDGTFPSAAGASMNLSAKFVNPLAMLRSFHWCSATTAMSGSGADRGTPGGANIDCGTPGTTIITPDHQVGDCKADRPASLSLAAGATAAAFGQVYEPNATNLSTVANDYYPFLEGEVGYGAVGSDASTWVWAAATWNASYSAASSTYDELTAPLVFPLAGQYAYGFRFRLVDGQGAQGPWGYCDANALVAADPPTSASFPVATVAPTIASTNPSQPKIGAALTIAGTGFAPGTTVSLGATSQTVVVTSSTQLDIAAAAASAGSQTLTVTSNGQSASTAVTVVE